MRMQTMPLFLLLTLNISLFAANRPSSPFEFVSIYSGIAIQEMERSSIPASITLAQGIMESMFGTSELAVNSNNLFGIKCKKNWAGPTYQLKDDDLDTMGNLIESCFRAYSSPEESFIDHTDFLVNGSNYKSLFELDRTDYVSWAHGLQRCGYATNPAYAKHLIATIEKYNLAVYDARGAVVPDYIPATNEDADINWAFDEDDLRMPPVYDIPLNYQPDAESTFGLPQDEGIATSIDAYDNTSASDETSGATILIEQPVEEQPAEEVASIRTRQFVREENTEDYLFELQPQEVIDFGAKGVILIIDPKR